MTSFHNCSSFLAPEQCKNHKAHDSTLLKPLIYALESFLLIEAIFTLDIKI